MGRMFAIHLGTRKSCDWNPGRPCDLGGADDCLLSTAISGRSNAAIVRAARLPENSGTDEAK